MNRRALFLQCVNAAQYPPVMNGSATLADSGWQVTVLSSPSPDTAALAMGAHPGREHVMTAARKGNAVSAREYLGYLQAATALALRLRPSLVYASDPLGALPGLLAARLVGARLVYHEHDAPGRGLRRLVAWARRTAARVAELVIVPNLDRGRLLQQELGFPEERLRVVWNLPSRAEIPPLTRTPQEPLRLYYHGSITPERVPLALVEAVRRLNGRAVLRLAGYEAAGAAGYVETLLARGRDGGAPVVEYLGQQPAHEDLLRLAARSHVGLALMPLKTGDTNLRHMVGASNKAFDYMAAGLALLVSDLPDWRAQFAEPGYGRSCDPGEEEALRSALAWYADHPRERRAMGMAGRKAILAGWNYEAAFAPIVQELSAARGSAP